MREGQPYGRRISNVAQNSRVSLDVMSGEAYNSDRRCVSPGTGTLTASLSTAVREPRTTSAVDGRKSLRIQALMHGLDPFGRRERRWWKPIGF